MKHASPAMPSLTRDATQERQPRGAGRIAGVLTLLAFGFAANSLLSTPQAEPPAVVGAMSATVELPAAGYAPDASTAEAAEVDAAVRNWVWETRTPEHRPQARYDFEELWLAR
jgi:hypothetical protein